VTASTSDVIALGTLEAEQTFRQNIPDSARTRLGQIAMALQGARHLAEECTDGDDQFMPIIGILALAEAELERLQADLE